MHPSGNRKQHFGRISSTWLEIISIAGVEAMLHSLFSELGNYIWCFTVCDKNLLCGRTVVVSLRRGPSSQQNACRIFGKPTLFGEQIHHHAIIYIRTRAKCTATLPDYRPCRDRGREPGYGDNGSTGHHEKGRAPDPDPSSNRCLQEPVVSLYQHTTTRRWKLLELEEEKSNSFSTKNIWNYLYRQ